MSLYNSYYGYENLAILFKNRNLKVHFIGVLGVSTYSLARLLRDMGYRVSGSDRESGENGKRLLSLGVELFHGHSASNILGSDLVVYSLSIDEENDEYIAARQSGIPTVSRAELMGFLMAGYRKRIAISGAHGKSTTTAMIDCILSFNLFSPTTLCGARLSTGEPLRIGERECFVFEACEYKDSFLSFCPTHSVILNIELDHTDYFFSEDEIYLSFLSESNAAKHTVINIDDILCLRLMAKTSSDTVSFGKSQAADYRYEPCATQSGSSRFKLYHKGEVYDVSLRLFGEFNVQNATAAIALCHTIGVPIKGCIEALRGFLPIDRRQECLGLWRGCSLYSDYAHHPSEIKATLSAFRTKDNKPLLVIFKPHTYSRTKYFLSDFAKALSLADRVIITDIYPAREVDNLGISPISLVEAIGSKASYFPDDKCAEAVKDFFGNILIMGAGNTDIVNKTFQKELKTT